MLQYRFLHIFKYFILLMLFNIMCFAKPSVSLGNIDAKVTKYGIEISGTVTGSGLKMPIPEYDQVTIQAELKNSENYSYPKFGEFYWIAKGCIAVGSRCLTKEEAEGKNIAVQAIASFNLRKTPVWLAYGGLGKWEKNAPATVTKKFKGTIDKKFCGKRVRIHAILKYVIGGPYANWPGISFHHDTKMMRLPECSKNSINNTSNGSNNVNTNDTNNRYATYRVSAQKEGFLKAWNDREINIDSTKTLIIWGTIYDNQNKPLPFTKVTLTILGKIFTAQSDSNGDFEFDITVNPKGNKVVKYNEDLHLKKPISHIRANLLSRKLVANGKEQNVKVKFTDSNGVLANKKLYISTDNIPLKHSGSTASYAKMAYDSKYISTNASGIAVFTVHSPKVSANTVNKYNDAKLFPISSSYHIYSLENGEKERAGSMKIEFYSPKPHITLRFPSGVKEGFWQSVPSKVYIDDLDSNHFKIIIRGYGRLKTKGSGVRYNKLIHQFDGKVFEFYFQPQKVGFDLNNQPNLWKQLIKVNRNALLSALIPIAQNGKLPIKYPASQEFKDTIDYIVARAGAKDYHNLLVKAHKEPSFQNTMDGAVGGALLGDALTNIIMKKEVPLGAALQLELLKAVYANASTIYGAYKDYNSIANAYEDVVPYSLMVIVIDDDGYKAVKQRSVFVKIWKKGK